MKKLFYFSFLSSACIMFDCCTSYSDVQKEIVSDEPAEIVVSVGAPVMVSVETRGHGTVGSLENSDENKWNKQLMHIYAIRANATDLTQIDSENLTDNGTFFLLGTATEGGCPMYAPMDSYSGESSWAESGVIVKYYPQLGSYNFMGYYIDDAYVSSITPTPNEVDIFVETDGTQDIMVANTRFDATDSLNIMKNAPEGATVEEQLERAYSTYSARRGVQPYLFFQHQLTRLSFCVKAGNAKAIEGETIFTTADGLEHKQGVYINKVQVKNVDASGTIKVTPSGICYEPGEDNKTSVIELKERRLPEGMLQPLTEKAPASMEYGTSFGESLLLNPASRFVADFVIREYVDADGNDVSKEGGNVEYNYNDIPLIAYDADGNEIAFEPGKTYNVTIKVYSLEKIEVTAVLLGWQHGGDVEIDTDY